MRKIFLTICTLITISCSTVFGSALGDVGTESTQGKAIEFLLSKGISQGASNFSPKRPISLAEFITMSLVALEIPDLPRGAASRFTDVPATAWFAPYIAKADALGLLDDLKSEKLLPNRALTRGEALKLGLKTFGIGVPITPPNEDFGFLDIKNTHRLARYVFRGLKMGVIEPVSDTKFGVSQKLNRGEAAELIYNLWQYGGEGSGGTIIIQNGFYNIPGLNLFEQVWARTVGNFLWKDKIDETEMLHRAIEGAVKALGDPYTNFLLPDQTNAINQDLSGKTEGIGAYLSRDEAGEIVIVTPIAGSPAEAAGLQPGDIVIAVDGKSVGGTSLEEVTSQIRGEVGTSVTLTIRRKGNQLIVPIQRAAVEIQAVNLKFKNGVAIIKISQFSTNADAEFAAASKEIVAKHPKGIILDLRNNGGGLVTAAVDVVSYFLPENSVVVKTKYRAELAQYDAVQRTIHAPTLTGYPVAVLINKGSASASEIVAAALQDQGIARVVGEPSFGKGTMQEISFFDDGTALKLTVAAWLSPKEQVINDKGIIPDLLVVDEAKTPDIDEILNQAIALF